MRVGFFVTCLVDLYRPVVGFAAIHLLERAGCEVVVPAAQTCCGQPGYNSGDKLSAQKIARQVIAAFGNKFATAAGTGTIDCKTATVGTVIGSTATCTGGANIGGTSAVNGNTLNIQNCSP